MVHNLSERKEKIKFTSGNNNNTQIKTLEEKVNIYIGKTIYIYISESI